MKGLQDRVEIIETNFNNIDSDIVKKLENIDLNSLNNITKNTSPDKENDQDKKITQNTVQSVKKVSLDEEKQNKPELENIKSVISERQQLIDQYLDENSKTKQSDHGNNTTINEKVLEDMKNDMRIEFNNDLNYHLDGIKD